MPQRKSAKKELRKNIKRRGRNLKIKQRIKLAIKKIKKSIESKDFDIARQTLREVYKNLDKAALKKIIHPNKAARKKSRLSLLLNAKSKITSPKEPQ